jgi:NIPSNAP protein
MIGSVLFEVNVVHVWAYRDANDWQQIRKNVMSVGIWPPKTPLESYDALIRQTSTTAIPAPFSPIC